jgi:membrane-bound lytic murein transglycosylase MltF
LEIRAHENVIYFHTNGRCFGLDYEMAKQLRDGLTAVLSGAFDRAVSQTFLQLQEEREARNKTIQTQTTNPNPSSRNTKPTLDQL